MGDVGGQVLQIEIFHLGVRRVELLRHPLVYSHTTPRTVHLTHSNGVFLGCLRAGMGVLVSKLKSLEGDACK